LSFFGFFFFLAVENALRPGAPPQTPPLPGAFLFLFFLKEEEKKRKRRKRRRRGRRDLI